MASGHYVFHFVASIVMFFLSKDIEKNLLEGLVSKSGI